MKRPKYHFLSACPNGKGKSIMTLPGQTFGSIPVPEGILVKDVRGGRCVENARRKADIGDVFFTATLRKNPTGLVAGDIHKLNQTDDVFLQDAKQQYNDLLKRNNAQQ